MADYSSGQLISTTPNSPAWGGQDVDSLRRTFGIGDTVHELAPETSIFFSYLSKLGKKPTDETVWKPMEYRSQWQRRNFVAEQYTVTGTVGTDPITAMADPTGSAAATHIVLFCDYNHQGKVRAISGDPDTASFEGYAPVYLTKNQILRIGGTAYKLNAEPYYYKTTGAGTGTLSTKANAGTEDGYAIVALASMIKVSSGSAAPDAGAAWSKKGQVIGSQWGEATGAPDGWRDELSDVEFFTQIFKTSVPLMSGSMQATKYRGYANEWKRIYGEHVKSHKMDLENAFLFGYGKYTSADVRNSWGIEPFIRNKGGKKYQLGYSGTKHGSGSGYDVRAGFHYDGVVDIMDDFMNYEGGNSGQKLCLTSRKVINALHKVGAGNFLSNSLKPEGTASDASGVFRAGMEVKNSSFMPIDITSISTSWGAMNFVAHPLFRHDMEDKAVCIDLKHVTMRPLAGNGHSRDTFVETNIQENDIDGRKDQIVTEAGLEILFPETHAVIDFEAGA
tara:strand:- start:735 stop:2246 length:1512 start_codon:yes stop_codon:yes gene_type:complete